MEQVFRVRINRLGKPQVVIFVYGKDAEQVKNDLRKRPGVPGTAMITASPDEYEEATTVQRIEEVSL